MEATQSKTGSSCQEVSLPPTINLHMVRACNYKCGFCFAGFRDCSKGFLPQPELHEILRQIAAQPLFRGKGRKVNFVGGEPTLSPTLVEDVCYAKSLGLKTSIVTNGSRLSPEMLNSLSGHLDLLAISIDSVDPETNRKIGRHTGGIVLTEKDYLDRLKLSRDLGMAIKVNTVVNNYNYREDMNAFILEVNPLRWKLFKVLRIEGENGASFGNWEISDKEFNAYVDRHKHLADAGIPVVPEANEDMYGTYAFISPDGRFIDNSQGVHRYSRPIVEVGIDAAFNEIQFSLPGFLARGGSYEV